MEIKIGDKIHEITTVHYPEQDQAYYDAADWRGTWAYDGGVFTNQASHHIDMLTWFMGEVESVKAIGTTRLSRIECEDTGAALLRFVRFAFDAHRRDVVKAALDRLVTDVRPDDLRALSRAAT